MNIYKTIAAIAAAVTIISCGHDEKQTVTYENPVLKATAPDPSVLRAEDGKFYMYTTGNGFLIFKSDDMINWVQDGRVFQDDNFPEIRRNDRKPGCWAPEARYINGKYVVFYTFWFGDVWLSVIGYAVSDSPLGPFVDKGILVDSRPFGVEQSIDQFYFEDGGKSYLFWGSFRGIYAAELDITPDVDITVKKETMQKVAGSAFEGTNIWKRGKYYYFFASTGNYAGGEKSTYRTVVARSENVLGPYVNKAGTTTIENGYEEVLDRSDKFSGPGHNAGLVLDDAGDTWMFYHAYQLSNLDLMRQGMLDKVLWTADDWPYIESGVPSDKAVAPYIKGRK